VRVSIRPLIRHTVRPVPRALKRMHRLLRQVWKGCQSARLPAYDVSSVVSALKALDGSYGLDDRDEEEPIFLLATSWRTGSTLLQRILVSNPRLLLWGEPLGRLALIPRLTESLCAISGSWPPAQYWVGERIDDLSGSWIANLYPPPSSLRAAVREWMVRWFGVPARARGFPLWGIKEVRLGAAEAYVLRWVFPKARFLVLVRHPCDAYRSAMHMKLWYRWPDWPIDCAMAFARHWNRLASSWLEIPEDFGHLIIKYEDLVSGSFDFRHLDNALGLTINEQEALGVRIGSSMNPESLSWYERRVILRETRRSRQAYGYEA
jgi:hypothetical protein